MMVGWVKGVFHVNDPLKVGCCCTSKDKFSSKGVCPFIFFLFAPNPSLEKGEGNIAIAFDSNPKKGRKRGKCFFFTVSKYGKRQFPHAKIYDPEQKLFVFECLGVCILTQITRLFCVFYAYFDATERRTHTHTYECPGIVVVCMYVALFPHSPRNKKKTKIHSIYPHLSLVTSP